MVEPLPSKSKEEGGLGILKLKTHNEALLMKNLDKFYNRRELPMGQTYLGKRLFQW
jgi:hypothetical protein